jgi:hypothetical protein
VLCDERFESFPVGLSFRNANRLPLVGARISLGALAGGAVS